MPPIVLATCGENVKIWGDPNYELSHHIGNTHSSNVSSICWSPDDILSEYRIFQLNIT